MSKLYPPLIEGTIPAFSGTTLVVPFSLNRTVAKTEIAGLIVKIKTVQGGTVLGTVKQTNSAYYNLDNNIYVKFDVSNISLNKGQYYKIQLAFLNGSEQTVGYYSTVGVVKYINAPEISISNLSYGQINSHLYTYTGLYESDEDSTEKLYSTEFFLYDSNSNLIIDSGVILHNTNLDDSSNSAHESYTIPQDLDTNEIYYLTMRMISSNGYIATTKKYKIIQAIIQDPQIDGTLVVDSDYDDGYIHVKLVGNKDANGCESRLVGKFMLSRAASNENWTWHNILSFSAVDTKTSRDLFTDYTTEQGVTYRYSLQQFNSYDVYSNRLLSEDITQNFEDAFLYDGIRQLKIRYNPKVTSFKTDILEAKIDTIGSKHPFIFRNGNVYYKEFPISGLISYKMDDNQHFLSWDEIGIISEHDSYKYRKNSKIYKNLSDDVLDIGNVETCNLEDYNIYAERAFKLTVLDWLTNGKIKLFRSPSEGNYIVRLLNTSLTPSDQLGRMLHTFTCTAYEMEDFSFSNLSSLGLLVTDDLNTYTTRYKTIQLASHSLELDEVLESLENNIAADICTTITPEQRSRIVNYVSNLGLDASNYIHQYSTYSYIIGTEYESGISPIIADEEIKEAILSAIGKVTYPTENINENLIYSINAQDMLPGTQLILTGAEGKDSDIQTVQIGIAGTYKATFENPIGSITVIPPVVNNNINNFSGQITYQYLDDADTIFSLLQSYSIDYVLGQQFIGNNYVEKRQFNTNDITTYQTNNIIEQISNIKNTILKIYQINFIKRPIIELFVKDWDKDTESYINNFDYNTATYYSDYNCYNKYDMTSLDEQYIYVIRHGRFDFTYQDVPTEGYFLDNNYRQGYYISNNQKYYVYTGYYIDGKSTADNLIIYSDFVTGDNKYSCEINIDGKSLDIGETNQYLLNNYNNLIDSITIGNGVICEISYQIKQDTYSLESTDKTTSQVKKLYQAAKNKLSNLRELLVTYGNFLYDKCNNTLSINSYTSEFSRILLVDSKLKQALDGIALETIENKNNIESVFLSLEPQYIAEVKTTYDNFIKQLENTLYTYERGNE